ncbi:MAG: hypothetical protein PSN37_02480 [Alphaproteobacteria bacterium]|nr:hypothetical protein [Alphaproteobacteria bacterium]
MTLLKTLSALSDEDHEELKQQKKTALGYVLSAWNDALYEGLETELIANAALFKAFSDLVTIYGEDAVAEMTAGLAQRVQQGEFSLHRTMQ